MATRTSREATDRRTVQVIGTAIDWIDWDTALPRILAWARTAASRYVCCCNVHSLVTASQEPAFSRALQAADMATPDGAPVAWMMRRLRAAGQRRISGPDLMLRLIEGAEHEQLPIYLYGSTSGTLKALVERLSRRFPALIVAGTSSPPFRPLSDEENSRELRAIADSGARLVFVGLGCPKQELWMATNSRQLPAVLLGVGAAFDFHAGRAKRAPRWMQQIGLEWVHRLCSEPRRLWNRYLTTNSIFLAKAAMQLTRRGLFRKVTKDSI